MIGSYTIKYRQPGQWFWRTLRRVTGDGTEHMYRFFHMEDDSIIFIPQQAEIVFMPDRQKTIAKRMSQESGQQVQRN